MENIYVAAFLLSLISGSAIFWGALAAAQEHFLPNWLQEEFRHAVTAVGGGALLAAIALVLIPEGMQHQPLETSIITFLAGGYLAMAMDRYFAKQKTAASQLVAMLLDFIPETIAIGAIVSKNFPEAILLAVIIFLQNLPEGFIAYREIKEAKRLSPKRILFWFFIIGMSGPIYVLLGATLLESHDMLLSMLMTFCAGGILYLMFSDIAPQVKLQNHWWPPMGALIGFLVGMIGYQLTQ